jgi:hypothetical protein
VTVNFVVTGGTAILTTDYSFGGTVGAAGGRLRFGAGVTSQTFNVIIQPDVNGEGPETLVLSLQNPSSGATLGTPSSTTITINDAQTSLSFATPFMAVPEGGVVKIPIVRTGPVAGVTSTAIFSAVAGVATAGIDFVPTPPGGIPVTFLPGSTTQTVSLTILPDAIPEGNEFLVAVLSNASANTVLGPIAAMFVTLTDDDPATFQFSGPTFTVKEGEPVAVITVNRRGTAAELAQTVMASVSTSDGTAHAGTDYTGLLNQTLTFGPNVTSQSLVIPIADNEAKDGNRNFFVALLPVTPGTTVGISRSAMVTIQDND